MSEDYTYKEAFIHYRDKQNKFDYYFLGIIVAALSLSIQTFNSSSENINIILIVISWVLFIVSFLSGFFRQERSNLSYMLVAQKMPEKKRKELLEQAKGGLFHLHKSLNEEWTKDEIEEELKNTKGKIKISDNFIKKYEGQVLHAYQIQKWAFIYASYFYILFKISNAISISNYALLFITIFMMILNIIIVKTYKHFLYKNIAL